MKLTRDEVAALERLIVVEALVDIRVEPAKHVDADALKAMHGAIRDQYPMAKEHKGNEEETSFHPLAAQHGFWYTSVGGGQVVQARVGGFALSHLAPYDTWEGFRAEAERLWGVYVEAVRPVGITRVALRFVNRLRIPLPSLNEFSDFLTAPPAFPPNLPQEISSFLTRVVMHEPSICADAILTQALEPMGDDDIVPIVIDIDCSREKRFDVDGIDAFKVIEALHALKDRVLGEAITDKVTELYRSSAEVESG